MPTFDEQAYLRSRVFSLCTGLRWRLQEFVYEFPGGAPSDLIAFINSFLTEIESGLAAISDITILKLHVPVMEELSHILNWLDNAHSAQTPRGLVQILDSIRHTLFPKAKLFVAPSAEYNYSIRDIVPPLLRLSAGPLSHAAQARLKATLPDSFYLVHFPRIERENILNHAVFGHEFGHPIADEFNTHHETEPTYQTRLIDARKKVEADPTIAAHIGSFTDLVERAKFLSGISATLVEIHRRGIQELVSDVVGIHLYGPSALFALHDLFISGELDRIPARDDFYPPSRYRIRLMLQMLAKLGLLDALRKLNIPKSIPQLADTVKSILDHLETLAAATSDLTQLKGNVVSAVAYDWLTVTLPEALKHVDKRLSTLTYPANTLLKEVPELLERLELEVPPNEIGRWPTTTPVDWRSTLVAAWLFGFHKTFVAGISAERRRDTLITIQALAQRGVEYAMMQQDYGAHIAAISKSP